MELPESCLYWVKEQCGHLWYRMHSIIKFFLNSISIVVLLCNDRQILEGHLLSSSVICAVYLIWNWRKLCPGWVTMSKKTSCSFSVYSHSKLCMFSFFFAHTFTTNLFLFCIIYFILLFYFILLIYLFR